MTLTITIEMDSAAFEPENGAECARILNALASRKLDGQLLADGDMGNLRDVNGNTVGTWEVSAKAARKIEYHDDSQLDHPYYSIDIDSERCPEGRRRTGYIARVDGMRNECQRDNAALIVAAVNSYDARRELVEAARATADELTAYLHGNEAVSIESVRDRLRAALAAVEGHENGAVKAEAQS